MAYAPPLIIPFHNKLLKKLSVVLSFQSGCAMSRSAKT
jgi:hypothetical protein